MDKVDLPSVLLKFLESQHLNSLQLIDCSERLFALETVLMALDQKAADLLRQQKDKAHAENQKLREQIDSTFLALQALALGASNPPN